MNSDHFNIYIYNPNREPVDPLISPTHAPKPHMSTLQIPNAYKPYTHLDLNPYEPCINLSRMNLDPINSKALPVTDRALSLKVPHAGMETDAAFILSLRCICLREDGQSDTRLREGPVGIQDSETESKNEPRPKHVISISHSKKAQQQLLF